MTGGFSCVHCPMVYDLSSRGEDLGQGMEPIHRFVGLGSSIRG